MRFLWIIACAVFFAGCSAKVEGLHVEPQNVAQLTSDLQALGDNVEYSEARLFAYEALSYPQTLAERYGLVYPPTLHNLLINTGLKERGLCYQWSEDMMAHLKGLHLQSFDLRWGVANKGELNEHNSVVVVAKGGTFQTGILIDPWRHSGVLYWAKVSDDPEYRWVENLSRSRYFGTVTQ
ncbi:MAG: hypothetical protein RBR12_01820 [Sulfurospirillum cavolei]|nr:hypothetical protein [Sulfurospirillum cavolei]